MNPVIENILTRRSIRAYRPDQIPEKDLEVILQAGSYAPNANGLQNWKFTAIQNPQVIQKVNQAMRQALLELPEGSELATKFESLIEKAKDPNAEFLYGAPTYIIVSHLKDASNALADTALAIGTMMLAAHSLGIGSCWLNQLRGLTNEPAVRRLLNELGIPENHNVYGSVGMGYAAEPPQPPAPRKDVICIIR